MQSPLKSRLKLSRPLITGLFAVFALMGIVVIPRVVNPNVSAAGTTVTINPSQKYQVMTGLGVNANVHNWKNGQLKTGIDMIADGIGVSTYRVMIDRCDFEAANDDADPNHFNWAYYDPIYSSGKMADLWATIAYLNSKNLQVSLDCMGGTPAWMGGSVGSSTIDTAKEDEFVEMIASMVYYGRITKGLNFTLLAPANEIDWNGNEGPHLPPDQYGRIMHKLAVKLDGLGLSDIKFVGPDLADAGNTQSYFNAISADTLVMGKFAHLGGHSYSGDSTAVAATLAGAKIPRLDYWMTEFSGPCPNCDNGSPNPGDWGNAFGSATQLHDMIEQGAAGAQIYDGWDGYYEHHGSIGYWGILAYNATSGVYTPRKSYYALGQYYKSVPMGSYHIGSASTNGGVDPIAFQDPATKRITAIITNTSGAAQTVSVAMGDPGITSVSSYYTNPTSNMVAGPTVAVANGVANFTIPNNTIYTVTGVPAGSATPTPTAVSSPTPSASVSPTPTPASLIGDINGDSKVNVFDLSALLSHWGSTDAASDVNHDGAVNVFDLSSLLSHWTG